MPKNALRGSGNSRRLRRGRERHLSVRSELRTQPDLQKIAKAVVALALAQAEKEAEEQAHLLEGDSETDDDK